MSQFVLVHGMSHGAWAWERVQPPLEAAGHDVIAIDLPGHGPRAHERARASIDGYARAVSDAMSVAGFDRAVVVGHSMAGAIIPHVAEMVPARVAHLIFVAAVVMRPGENLLDTQIAAPFRPLLLGLAASGGGSIQYPAATERARWMGDLPPGHPDAIAALARMTPQPLRPLVERVDQRRFSAMSVPRSYIRCLRDQAVTVARAAEYAARLGVVPIDLDCAHNAMLSKPEALANLLSEIASGYPRRRKDRP